MSNSPTHSKKALDLGRSSMLPRIAPGASNLGGKAARSTSSLVSDDSIREEQHKRIRELLSDANFDSEENQEERSTVLSQLREQHRLEKSASINMMQQGNQSGMLQTSKSAPRIFTIDQDLLSSFALPGKPDEATTGSLDIYKKKLIKSKSKNIKVQQNQAVQEQKVEDAFAFLSNTLGAGVSTTVPRPQTLLGDIQQQQQQGSFSSSALQAPAAQQIHTNPGKSDDIDEMMQTIRTGDDAVNFFARFGSDTPIKFIYLVNMVDPKRFLPYDLYTVSEIDKLTDYYTMSPAGIVSFEKGEPSECLPLSNWVRQKTDFKILRNIRFYKFYLHRKSFMAWKNNVRFQLFAKQRERVTTRLFLSRKTCLPSILSIKKRLLDVQTINLLNLDLKTCEKDAFFDQQSTNCTKVGLIFEETMRLIIASVNNVIVEVKNMYQHINEDGANTALTFGDTAGPAKNKSLVLLKHEKAQKKVMKQRARHEYNSLPDFIRYIDYMAVGTFVELAVATTRMFYEEFVKTRKAGIFETTVRFSGINSTSFSPDCSQIQEMLSSLLDTVINTVGGVNRVVYLNTQKSSTGAPSHGSGPVIQRIVRESRSFTASAANIQAKVALDFENAEGYASVYEAVRPIYDFNMTWDFEAFKAKPGGHDMAGLKMMMELIANWNKELEKLRNKPIGILEVDSKRLKAELNPLREARLEELKWYIKDVAKTRCIQLVEHYKECLNKLSGKPTVLKDFAAMALTVSSMREEEKNLFKMTSSIDQMYNLLQQYEVTVPPEDSVLHEDLHESQAQYRRDIDGVSAYKDQKLGEMVASVEANIVKLKDSIESTVSRLDEPIFNETSSFSNAAKVLEELAALGNKVDNADNTAKVYMGYQKLFNTTITEYKELEVGREKFEQMKSMWELVRAWNEKQAYWLEAQFTDLNVEEIDRDVQVFSKDSYNLHKRLNNKITEMLKDKVNDFKALVPNIMDLGNPNMMPRHFETLFKLIQHQYYPGMQFTLSLLLKHNIMNFKDQIADTSGRASGEAQLEDSLSKIVSSWGKTKFIINNHRDQPGLFVLGSLEEIFTLLEDNQVTLQTMLGSRFISLIRDRVEEWEKKLAVVSETLDEWIACQRAWMYLENIFGAEDIQKQLPAESQKFLVVDRSWKSIMTRTNNDPLVINLLVPLEINAKTGETQPLLDAFLTCNDCLESIQRSLEEYLETKRQAFPRFYFLSNDELLEILSQTRDPHAVQPHMSKCFDAIKRIKFGDGKKAHDIIGIMDPDGEYVQLTEDSRAEGAVETWLLQFEKKQRKTLYDLCKRAYFTYAADEEGAIFRAEWLWAYPAQVIICIDQVTWTQGCALALYNMSAHEKDGVAVEADRTSMEHFLHFSLRQIDAMVDLIRTPLNRQQRTMMGALLTIDVHARDVVRSMVTRNTDSLTDFEWTKQLRYYWDIDLDDVFVKQTNSCFRYGYEYLGNGPRLVITPLTDTCYMTLTGALHMRLGGAPAGPAGTGKTETTKDLAKALAVYCVVFNCSDGLDYKIMGRFFSGLAQQGAWSCFDEFNRIDIEVLSVIAQQVLCIQQAVTKEVTHFDFEGKYIPLNMSFGTFITMNPGYAGRTELPDNLKSLFRPVAMMVPDYRMIAEIMLFAEGFANALPLSNKMSQLYALSSEQLSKQSHYDFGMRAVKTVLVAAGQLKRKEPETNEDILLIRAMRDSNIPKFLEHDIPLFQGIISDLFPGIKVPYVDYGLLQSAIESALEKLSLQKVPTLITKCIQVHETQLVRHGMMVVGETGSGKSTNVKVLSTALGYLEDDKIVDRDGFYKHVDLLILNPKSITAGELYGEFNQLTNEWKDGIVPKLVRDCVNSVNEGSTNRKWIVFDGPVDAIWIENMNTVLDDNKTLCLANSERIKLPSTLHMMFEVQDLKVASPATVSRCGMVFMEQVHVGMMSLVRTWGATELKAVAGLKCSKDIVKGIESHLEACIDFLRLECKEKVATTNNGMTQSLLNIFLGKLSANPEDVSKLLAQDVDLMNGLMVWSIIWSIGANIIDASRQKFADFLKSRFITLLSSKYSPILADPYGVCLCMDGQSREVKSWNSLMTNFKYDVKMPYFSILVPTMETTRYRHVLDLLMNADRNVLFIAETGVGKSVVIGSFLNEMVATGKVVTYIMGYSAQTKPANLRDVLESKLEKKRKNLLGPPSGKKMFMFIDDLNMPALEYYGAQPPNELLRQVIDHGGMYDVDKLFFKNIKDVVFASACAPPGGGRNNVSPRLLRHFHLVWLTSLSQNSMTKIFSSILAGFLEYAAPQSVSLADPIVQGSVDIYIRIQKELLPTPLKSHYTFNLRDLSKIFQGMLSVKPRHVSDNASIVKLWAHESSRVFRDRLINQDDQTWFNNAVLTALHGPLINLPTWTTDDFADIIFGDFMTRSGKEYQQLKDMGKVNQVLAEYLDEYNITFPSRMELVFFRDAVNHVARIARVLAQPRGNALLVGVGGSGRQSLSKMASFMADYKCKQIEITRGYGMNEFHENLKEILMIAGAKNTPTVFLFSDTQIVTETFLEDINNILNSGEVPNLYAPDEIEKIVGMVRPLAKAAGKLETKEAILQHYVYLVRENLHIVLCMSPIGAGFRTRCRMFPSLVNCCTIDWFSAWPEDALYSVAERMFDSQKELGIGDYVDSLSTMCNKMHRIVETETARYFQEVKRYNYTTPTSYLELIKLYVDILKKQRAKISADEKRYRVGLDKLTEVEGIVANLEVELTEMQPVLEKAAIDTEKLLQQVTIDQKDADAQAAIVEVDVAEANKVAAAVKVIKDDCQADLDEAMPAYESAVKALATLDKKSVQEMKAFNNPPEMVKFTLEAVCILMEVKPDNKGDYWGEAKKLMSQMDFMDQLKTYDKDNIKPQIIKKIMKYFDDPRFLPELVKAQSSAAMCLCMWCRAMVVYDKVAKNIEPKKQALREAEEKLAKTMAELDTKKAALAAVIARVAGLQRLLKETQDKKAELEAQAAKAQKQLVRAGQLIGGLGGEKIRWKESATYLQNALINLVGDMCLAAGCLAYLGPFTSQFRTRIVEQWIVICKDNKLPCGDFSLLRALAVPVVVRGWQIDGLPADDFSCENGLMTSMGRRWPLMIDPQGQANRWIRNMYSKNNLQIIKLTEKDFLRTLENGIRYGAPVLLENVGQELDPSLEPVLLKQVFKRAGQILLRLGDTDVPYSDEFKFLITTKLANPHYMPEVCIKVTIINFTVTMKGLEDQLLVDVIKNERPDLEEKKDKLVVSIANDQKQLLEIEEQILSMLASASGNILDDEELINALARSKMTSSAINVRLTEAETTTREINETREGYRVVATRGSVIYFVVANLALVDPMYQSSLQYYKALFNGRLQKTEKKAILTERLDLLIKDITTSIYSNVCRGLFEKDKLLFSFSISAKIFMTAGEVSEKEWLVFMVGVAPKEEVVAKNPFPADLKNFSIPERSWINVVMLENELPVAFQGLANDFKTNTSTWRKFLTTDTPHSDKYPGDWDNRLNPFQKLLLIRVLREEKIVFAVRVYVRYAIGNYFTESPPFDLEGAFGDSTNVSPLIFILSPGADPTDYLLALANSKGKGNGGLRIISLGQGQGPIAERAIDAAMKGGDWVCLQNCHLAVSWLARLEQIVERNQNDSKDINPDFRLWLTSMPSTSFPVPVLQNGIKVTNEPPRGLRANLMRTFLDLSGEDFDSCSKPQVFKKLVFATAFFNALILERRKFGAVGWNIAYDWMNSDLKAAMTQVRMYVEEQQEVPWETLNVSVAFITYGGRVTDMWDKRTIMSILRKYFEPGILDDSYRFSSDGNYYAPPVGSIESFRDYIRGLSPDDQPDVFGLHPNAAITFQQKESRALVSGVVLCAGGGGGGGSSGGGDTDARVNDIAVKMTNRMPGNFDQRKAHPTTFKKFGDTVNSLGVFLGQELDRFNGLINVMLSTLRELQRAIKGEVVMSGELEVIYNCFVFQKVPPVWEAAGYPCLKPLPSWTEDFFMRIETMQKWLVEGPRPTYWLSGFFFPQGFMTAVKQTYSRLSRIAVDTLRIGCETTCFDPKDLDSPPEIGAYIYGLYMEGGRFNRSSMQLEDSLPRILLDPMPAIWLKPVITSEYNPQSCYDCPLYKTSLRAGTLSTTGHSTNFVVSLPIPTLEATNHWVRRGCAMLCMHDE